MSHLVPCPECSRHVRVTETACPFCSLPLDLADAPSPVLPGQRLSRAATLAFGATLASATALAACGGDAVISDPVPFYGAPSAGASAGGDGGSSGSGTAGAESSAGRGGEAVSPVYGAPPQSFGGSEPMNEGGAAGVAVYGAPAAGVGNEAGADGEQE